NAVVLASESSLRTLSESGAAAAFAAFMVGRKITKPAVARANGAAHRMLGLFMTYSFETSPRKESTRCNPAVASAAPLPGGLASGSSFHTPLVPLNKQQVNYRSLDCRSTRIDPRTNQHPIPPLSPHHLQEFERLDPS